MGKWPTAELIAELRSKGGSVEDDLAIIRKHERRDGRDQRQPEDKAKPGKKG